MDHAHNQYNQVLYYCLFLQLQDSCNEDEDISSFTKASILNSTSSSKKDKNVSHSLKNGKLTHRKQQSSHTNDKSKSKKKNGVHNKNISKNHNIEHKTVKNSKSASHSNIKVSERQ